MEKRYTSFEEFWPYYVREHSNPLNRKLHFIGTSLALGCAAGAATGQFWLWPAVPVVGYGFAWVGHFFVEKNRPATFTYPLWSLMGDFVMWKKMLTGQMDAEVERALAHRKNGQNGHALDASA
ncbi:MAG: Mpo1-like protein [Polyangia bacterium]|jgi:hypothetical protein